MDRPWSRHGVDTQHNAYPSVRVHSRVIVVHEHPLSQLLLVQFKVGSKFTTRMS